MNQPNAGHIQFLDADAVDAIHSATIMEQTAELGRLRAEVAELRDALEQCADDWQDGFAVCRATKDMVLAILARTQKETEIVRD